MIYVDFTMDKAPIGRLQDALKAALFRGVQFLHARVQEALSVPNHDGKSPSRPGEAPRMRSGVGRKSVVYVVAPNGEWGMVGPSMRGWHMHLLELGTRRVRPRPWLRATAARYAAEIADVCRPSV